MCDLLLLLRIAWLSQLLTELISRSQKMGHLVRVDAPRTGMKCGSCFFCVSRTFYIYNSLKTMFTYNIYYELAHAVLKSFHEPPQRMQLRN